MNRIGLALASLLALAGIGCDDTRSGTDSGVIVLMDSGVRPDAGGGGGCDPITVPAPTMAVCAAATATCFQGCTDPATAGTCITACIDADPMADNCDGCLNQAIFSCATRNGCNDEFGNLDCCAATCVEGQPCIEAPGPCVSQYDGFFACFDALPDTACQGVANVCFMPPSGFLPGAQVPQLSPSTLDALRQSAAARYLATHR